MDRILFPSSEILKSGKCQENELVCCDGKNWIKLIFPGLAETNHRIERGKSKRCRRGKTKTCQRKTLKDFIYLPLRPCNRSTSILYLVTKR